MDQEASSLNTLRMSLLHLKERCQRQQKTIDGLEKENDAVRESRDDLYAQVRRLHEANVALREKNLGLNAKLHEKSRENVEIRDNLNSLRDQHENSLRQLDRLQTHFGDPVDADEADDDVAMIGLAGEGQMLDIRAKLLEQREQIKEAVKKLAESVGNKRSDPRAISLPATTTRTTTTSEEEASAAASSSPRGRTCPMCEARFGADVAQEAFEAHVFDHFNYEEGETLRNFDLVPDATMPFV